MKKSRLRLSYDSKQVKLDQVHTYNNYLNSKLKGPGIASNQD